jgi:DNA-binding NtrC family response regulator
MPPAAMAIDAPSSTLEEAEPGSDAAQRARLAIVWISSELERPTTWLAGRDELVIGRDPEADVPLTGALLSRRHARLRRTGSSWFIQDMDSRNGVFSNGQSIKQGAIAVGDVLRVGSWLGMLLSFAPGEEPKYELLDEGLFGGPDLKAVIETVNVAASSNLSVVLEGATGTGKEQLARAIHRKSRRKGELVAINCAMYQGATAVGELFGYRKGAFTGAESVHRGLIPAAANGTLLLDEVTDLALDVQAQLLRAIENGQIIPLGESRATTVDVRYLAATQQPLHAAVDQGRFRADLRARLEGLRIQVPPLRQRRGDIPFLFLHLLRALSPRPITVEARLLERLSLYDWPLNVREMVGLVRRLATMYPEASNLTLEQVVRVFPELDARKEPKRAETSVGDRSDPRAFRPAEIAALQAAVARHSGSVSKAAAELNISRQRAYRMLKRSGD